METRRGITVSVALGIGLLVAVGIGWLRGAKHDEAPPVESDARLGPPRAEVQPARPAPSVVSPARHPSALERVEEDEPVGVEVRCPVVLGEEVPTGGQLWEMAQGIAPSVSVAVAGDELRFTALRPAGRGMVYLDAHVGFPVEWRPTGPGTARCVGEPPEPVLESAQVTGVVVDLGPEEAGEIHVRRCDGGSVSVDDDGRFSFQAAPGPCRLLAMRRHGQLTAYGPPAELELEPWEVAEVALEPPPPWRPAGLGIAYETGEEGVRVLRRIEGAPAQRAGLRAGDLIVAVDGVDMRGVETREFLEYGLGPEGSEVELTVLRGGAEHTIVFTRETLPSR